MSCTNLRVKELLKEHGWTTKVLAEKTGMSESYLTHIKNSTRRWNEDSLKKIADAFGVEPISLLTSYKSTDFSNNKDFKEIPSTDPTDILSKIKKIPMMGTIPSYPSDYNNHITQITSGYKEMFIPVFDEHLGDSAFCLVVENQIMSPRFVKGDYLIIVPGMPVASGDTVAVEFRTDKLYKQLANISFSENLIMLEHVNHKHAPIALVKNKDYCRIIGKVDQIYQKFA